MSSPNLSIRRLGLLFGIIGLLMVRDARADTSWPLIQREDVLKSLLENGPQWTQSMGKGSPRLFFDEKGREETRKRLRADAAAGKPDITALLTKVKSLVPQPYMPPEGEVKKGRTEHDASQELWQRTVGDDIVALCIAGLVDDSPKIREKIHQSVLLACGYPTWGLYGPNMDLAAAHVARGIALAYDWYPELWSPADRTVIVTVIQERVHKLLEGLYGKAFWSHGYSDNHNHVSTTGLAWCGIAFYDIIPEAPEWLAAARLNFQKVAHYVPSDGSSLEGSFYWSYGISFILQYIEGTRHVIDSADLYNASFLRHAAAYRLSSSTSGCAGILKWGDAGPKDGSPQHILDRLAEQYHDSSAGWLANHIPYPSDGAVSLAYAALWQPSASMEKKPDLLDFHQWVGDVVVTRSGWGEADYLLSIKSGFTNRSHTHLDAGALALAFGNEWLLTTPGYGKGSGKLEFWDFGVKRWLFFSNATESEATLLIDGQSQRADREARGTIDQFLSTPFWCWTNIDLTQAYKNISNTRRSVLHRRNDYILVFDAVTAPKPVSVEWLAQLGSAPLVQGNSLTVPGGMGQLRLEMLSPAKTFTPRKPTLAEVDIPEDSIHTMTVKETGESVNFIALLQPTFVNVPLAKLKTSVLNQTKDRAEVLIEAANWSDHIFTGDSPFAMHLASASNEAAADINATAQTAAFRKDAKGLESCLFVNATTLQLPFCSFTSKEPRSIAFQRTADGAWIVDANEEAKKCLSIASDMILQSMEPETPKTGVSRYLLSRGNAPIGQAKDWLASLVQFREKPPVPIRELAKQSPIPASVAIPLEAEDFAYQKLGHAEVVAGRPGATSGKSVRGYGSDGPEHSITWRFQVKEAGRYFLKLRYASNLDEVKLTFLLDGAAPDKGLVQLPLPGTGGWSILQNNWKDKVTADATGHPFAFDLAAGDHELRLADPSGGLSLDRLEFFGSAK